jgi:hypothetical protein
MIQFGDFKKIQPTFDKNMEKFWKPFSDLPIELQYYCFTFFPREIIIHIIDNKNPSLSTYHINNKTLKINTKYILEFSKNNPIYIQKDDKLWDLLCKNPFGNDKYIIKYNIYFKQIKEKHHCEYFNEFYGNLICKKYNIKIEYNIPNYWNYSILNSIISKFAPDDYQIEYCGYADDYWD